MPGLSLGDEDVFELGGTLADDGALVIEIDVGKWTSFTAEDLIG